MGNKLQIDILRYRLYSLFKLTFIFCLTPRFSKTQNGSIKRYYSILRHFKILYEKNVYYFPEEYFLYDSKERGHIESIFTNEKANIGIEYLSSMLVFMVKLPNYRRNHS